MALETTPDARTDGAIDLVQRARELAPLLRERAPEAESARSLPAESVADLRSAGIFRLMQPRRLGGLELGFDVLNQVAVELGRGCASTAWVTVVLNGGWFLASFPEQAADEVWGDDSDALVGGVLAPTTSVEKVAGGYRISGRWPYSSGIDHCQWNIVGGFDLDPSRPPDIRLFLLPASDYTIDDTWFTLGLRATGSKTTVVKDVFVPEHRTLPLGVLREGESTHREDSSDFYRVPFGVFFPLSIACPIVGASLGALEIWAKATVSRITPTGERVAEQIPAQIAAAEAAADIDSALLLIERGVREAQAAVAAGHVPGADERARSWRDGAYAVRLCNRALDLLLEAGGGQSIRQDDPVQRAWRDARTAVSHISMRWPDAASRFGRAAFGLDPPNPFFN